MKDKQLRRQFENFKKDVIKVIYDHIPLHSFEYFNQYFIELAEKDLAWAEKHGKKEISRNCANGLTYDLSILQIHNKKTDYVVYKSKKYKVKDKDDFKLVMNGKIDFDPSPEGFIPEIINK